MILREAISAKWLLRMRAEGVFNGSKKRSARPARHHIAVPAPLRLNPAAKSLMIRHTGL